jgi:hypothetical protein
MSLAFLLVLVLAVAAVVWVIYAMMKRARD